MFGFIIDKDHLDDRRTGFDFIFRVDCCGAPPTYTLPFRAYDDDNELYYECRAGVADDNELYRIFEFLRNDSGVTYLIVDYPHAKDTHFP